MSKGEHLRVSFEGERGSGKTTIISLLVPDLIQLGYKVQINRNIAANKALNLAHIESTKFHKKWITMVKDGKHSTIVEAMAFAKFHHALSWFLEEEEIFDSKSKERDILICDRDIDTTVLYATIEVILSNPDKYAGDATKKELIKSLWSMVSSVRNFPDITFCLTSSSPEVTLARSHQSKQDTNEVYNLDRIQEYSQQLAAKLLVPVVSNRPSKQESVFWLSVDNMNSKELEGIILSKLLL